MKNESRLEMAAFKLLILAAMLGLLMNLASCGSTQQVVKKNQFSCDWQKGK